MIMIPQKMNFLHLTACHKYSTLHLTQDHHLPSTPLPLMNTWKKEQLKKRISKLSPWTMNIGLLKRFLTDHCAYMNIHYHTDYAYTHVPYADYQTPPCFKIMDLSDISEFEDLMTTSSDEDIPALEDSVH